MVDPKKTNTAKLYVRFANTEDFQNILDYYKDNEHDNVRKRAHDLLEELVGNGSIVIIEDEDDNIVASSISYPHSVIEDGIEKRKWVELGSARITKNGFPGLFDVMCSAQTLRAFLVEPPEERFVAHMEHAGIKKIAGRLGWREFEAPQALLEASNETVENADLSKRAPGGWYHCGVEGMSVMASYLMRVMDNPISENKRTGEKVEISLERCKLLMKFKENIKNLAENDYGHPDNSDMKRSVSAHRDKWLYKLR